MQMRSGGPAGLSHEADRVVLRHARAAAHRDAAEMTVHRRVLAVVAEDDDVAVSPLDAGVLDGAVGHGTHARADRRRIVDALVRAPAALDRVFAHTEPRAHP